MRLIFFSLACSFITAQKTTAQACIADYFFTSYKGAYDQRISRSITTSRQELITVGSVFYQKGEMYFTDGWITKMTAQGNILWSKRYSFPRHNVVAFHDILLLPDSTYFIVGTVSYLWPIDTLQYSRDHWGILLHIDKQGRMLSSTQLSARFEPLVEQTTLQSISKTSNGDFILCGVITDQRNSRSTQLIIKINQKGKITWTSTLYSSEFAFDFGLTKTVQVSNGTIVVAGLLYQRAVGGFEIPKVGYYFIGLDNTTGAVRWSHSYLFVNNPSSSYFATTESLQRITELPGGNLSFVAYITDASCLSNPPYTSTSVNIITDEFGKLQQAIAYQNNQRGTYSAAAVDVGNGEQIILIDDEQNAPLLQIDSNGQMMWMKGYAVGSTISPASLNMGGSGYYMFLNDRGPYGGTTYLMKVDATASIDCKIGSAQLTSRDATASFTQETMQPDVKTSNEDTVLFSSVTVLTYDYPISSNNECIKACCKDIKDTVPDIILCSGQTYTLPDNYVVKDSGAYSVALTTPKGCDSISSYHFSVLKNPDLLKLYGKNCFEDTGTVVLIASSGFDHYNWMNTVISDSTYAVTKPGVYWVSISNYCGTKRDSLEVFEKCDFPVYMPNAFTPNGDGVNDDFGFPIQNKNLLLQLITYNRWGQRVFQTDNPIRRWDGTYKGSPQPNGAYLYVLQTKAPNGKNVTSKGTVTLIR